jgi:hypothetical protein
MQKIAMLLLVGMVCSTAQAASPRETVEAFHAALSKGDKASAAALLSPELLIYESGYVERSRAEYASHHLDGDIAFAKTMSSKVLKQGVRIPGKVATRSTANWPPSPRQTRPPIPRHGGQSERSDAGV